MLAHRLFETFDGPAEAPRNSRVSCAIVGLCNFWRSSSRGSGMQLGQLRGESGACTRSASGATQCAARRWNLWHRSRSCQRRMRAADLRRQRRSITDRSQKILSLPSLVCLSPLHCATPTPTLPSCPVSLVRSLQYHAFVRQCTLRGDSKLVGKRVLCYFMASKSPFGIITCPCWPQPTLVPSSSSLVLSLANFLMNSLHE